MGTSGREQPDQEQRWHGQRSSFSWEQDALEHVRGQMPLTEPYRAWQTFTFTAAPSGHVREVDLFIATPGGLALVEIKSHPGRAANNGSTWVFRDGGVTRTIDNPLHFTDQKSKELRGQLQRAADDLTRGKRVPRIEIPRIEPAVFLSAENLTCLFDGFQRQRVYGRDGLDEQTGLPGIWAGFLNQPPRSDRNRVTADLSWRLPELLTRIGVARLHKIGKVGPYELAARSFDNGPTWEDYLAGNPSMPHDQPRRVRVYLAGKAATDEEKTSTQRAARREYLALRGISHDGIVRAEQYSDELLAGPAVVFQHGGNWQRLDHFMATAGLPAETRLDMIRQLAEALDHAHRRHLYHRALAPRAVWVELSGRYPILRIADWQVAARPHGTATATGTPTMLAGPAALLRHVERSAGPYLAPDFTEPDAPAVLLDVFGLGALSYLILTGAPPATDRAGLAGKLTAERALSPSAVTDSISPQLDALIRKATALYPTERTGSVKDFIRELDRLDDAGANPEARLPVPDPLTAVKGDVIEGWKVERILGKGSTSRALLVTRDSARDDSARDDSNATRRVLKVALNDGAARRLEKEAQQLDQLNDSHVARLLDLPFQSGPPGQRRTLIGVEYVGDHTLAEELRRGGPLAMTINELERYGEDLFQAVTFLDRRGVWHRDIKPENLALRPLPRKGRELVLFDFSLAGTPDAELGVGTKDYLDPFLGTPGRQRYDQAAELYAVAVTLHEMASGELPSWGDDIVPAGFLPPDAEVQLAEDVFDPVIRDGLVAFFRKALHRDAAQRYASLHAMARAWAGIFTEIETVPPLTTASTLDDADAAADDADDEQAMQARRDAAAGSAAPDTPLPAAGLSPYALSIALRHLSVGTCGELARVNARRITTMKGIGRVTRYELVRRSREWRERFDLAEADYPRSGDVDSRQEHQNQGNYPERTRPAPQPDPASRDVADSAAGDSPDADPAGGAAERLAHLPVDEVVRRLVPDEPALAVVTGLAAGPAGHRAGPWASRQDVARLTGMSVAETAMHADRLRARWAKSVRALTSVREDVAEILREHGRILGLDQLAAGLLARRGADSADPAERLRLAALCVRAAVETEELLTVPKLVSRRIASAGTGTGGGVLVALTDAGEEGMSPRDGDLFAYAELLGEQADALAARDPLPGITEIRQALYEVPTPGHATRLSDTDLVLLAAAASARSAATARLELYPRDLEPLRALKISQAGALLSRGGADDRSDVDDKDYVRRVLARFPDLVNPPKVEDIPRLLRALGYDIERRADGRLHARSSSQLSGPRGTERTSTGGTAARLGLDRAELARQRLAEARRRGGFVAVKTSLEAGAAVCGELARMEGVVPVDVTRAFVTLLREIVAARGRPRWEVVLAADSAGASEAARSGFAGLLAQVWDRLDTHVRAVGNDGAGGAGSGSIVLLHDATPLARYPGGNEVLARLAVAARDSRESPRGLWLLCPMTTDPKGPPLLDGETVAVIPGDAEQLHVPGGFASQGEGHGGMEYRAS